MRRALPLILLATLLSAALSITGIHQGFLNAASQAQPTDERAQKLVFYEFYSPL